MTNEQPPDKVRFCAWRVRVGRVEHRDLEGGGAWEAAWITSAPTWALAKLANNGVMKLT